MKFRCMFFIKNWFYFKYLKRANFNASTPDWAYIFWFASDYPFKSV